MTKSEKKRFTDYMNDANDIISIMLYDIECDDTFPVHYDLKNIKSAKTFITKAELIIRNGVKNKKGNSD